MMEGKRKSLEWIPTRNGETILIRQMRVLTNSAVPLNFAISGNSPTHHAKWVFVCQKITAEPSLKSVYV